MRSHSWIYIDGKFQYVKLETEKHLILMHIQDEYKKWSLIHKDD